MNGRTIKDNLGAGTGVQADDPWAGFSLSGDAVTPLTEAYLGTKPAREEKTLLGVGHLPDTMERPPDDVDPASKSVEVVTSPDDCVNFARAFSYTRIVTDLDYSPNGREGLNVIGRIAGANARARLGDARALLAGLGADGIEEEPESAAPPQLYVWLRPSQLTDDIMAEVERAGARPILKTDDAEAAELARGDARDLDTRVEALRRVMSSVLEEAEGNSTLARNFIKVLPYVEVEALAFRLSQEERGELAAKLLPHSGEIHVDSAIHALLDAPRSFGELRELIDAIGRDELRSSAGRPYYQKYLAVTELNESLSALETPKRLPDGANGADVEDSEAMLKAAISDALDITARTSSAHECERFVLRYDQAFRGLQQGLDEALAGCDTTEDRARVLNIAVGAFEVAQRYGISFASEDLSRWEPRQIEIIQDVLARVPETEIVFHSTLHKIHREAEGPNPGADGAFQLGALHIYDAGVSNSAISADFGGIDPLYVVFAHELGHSFHHRYMSDFMKLSGWERIEPRRFEVISGDDGPSDALIDGRLIPLLEPVEFRGESSRFSLMNGDLWRCREESPYYQGLLSKIGPQEDFAVSFQGLLIDPARFEAEGGAKHGFMRALFAPDGDRAEILRFAQR